MGPSSAFQDEVFTKGVHPEARDKGLPGMKNLDPFMFKAEQQSAAASGRASMPEAKLCSSEGTAESFCIAGVGGKQNPTFLLLLQCP